MLAKRAAVIHLLFNLAGTLFFMLLLRNPVQSLVYKLVPVNVPKQIAAGHVFFNILNVAIMFPFSELLVKASEYIIRKDDSESGHITKYIDERLLVTHSIALTQTSKEVLHLGNIAFQQFETAKTALFDNNEEAVYKVFELEKRINEINKATLDYLVKLDKVSLTNYEKDKLVVLMNSINDIERVGDHIDNIGELVLYKIENKANFSEEANQEILEMFDKTMEAFKYSLNALASLEYNDCKVVMNNEEEIDKMYKILRNNHIERLNNSVCDPTSGIVFLDVISNLERIGDHSLNIAESIMEVI